MDDLLVLGTNIQSKDHFLICAYNLNTNRYIIIRRNKNLLLKSEINIWNIFSKIKCKLYKYKYFYEVIGEPVLIEHIDTIEGKKYFKSMNSSIDKFLSHYNVEPIAMISVDKVLDIIKDYHNYKTIFYIRGKKYTFYLKDQKILSYFRNHDEDYDNCKSKLLAYMNSKSNDTYIIIHKDKRPYIFGLHSI